MEGWIAVTRSTNVTSRPCQVSFRDRKYVTYRNKERVEFFPDACKHRGMALHKGKVLNDGTLECPYHGWTYDSAQCRMPSGKLVCKNSDEYIVKENDGLVWIQPKDIKGLADPPSMGKYWFDTVIKAPAQLIIENGIDPNHASWVHANPFGFGKYQQIPRNLRHEDDILTFNYVSKLSDTHNYHTVVYPYTTWSHVVLPNGQKLRTYVTLCPETAETTRIFVGFTHNMPIPDQALLIMGRAIVEQDRAILENLDPMSAFDGTPGQHDELIERYRSILATLRFK